MDRPKLEDTQQQAPKFSPGPWAFDDYGSFWLQDADGKTLMHIDPDSSETFQKTEPNAFLVLAAPDLYAALDALVKHKFLGYQSKDYVNLYRNAVNALARARGEVQP